MSLPLEVEVRRDGRRAAGRIEGGLGRLLVPRTVGLEEIAVAEDLLPDALARLVDLGPRLTSSAGPFRVPAEALGQALARGDHEPSSTLDRTEDTEAEPLRSVLLAGYAHWRVEVRAQAAAAAGASSVEILDTEACLWLVSSDPPEVELSPTTPTAVFGLLCGLVPGSRGV